MLHFKMPTLLSFWENSPLSMHAVLRLFPVHAAAEPASRILQGAAPVEVTPSGWGGWNGSCTLNKCSLKARRYLQLPSGCELMETQLWKCSAFPGCSSMEHRESSSDPSAQVMVSGFISGYQNDRHRDPSTPFQSWFPLRETNFQLSDPLVGMAGRAGQPRALPCPLNPTRLCP